MQNFLKTVNRQVKSIRGSRKELQDLNLMKQQTHLQWVNKMIIENQTVHSYNDIELMLGDIDRKLSELTQQINDEKDMLLRCFIEYVIENG